jgi:hypothetical protein
MIVRCLKFCWRDVSNRLEQPALIEPIDPFQGSVFHRFQMTPRAATIDHFGFVEPDDRLGERVVVGITDAAYRRLRARFGQPLRVSNRQILTTADALLCVKP